jgi:hypothetical protein
LVVHQQKKRPGEVKGFEGGGNASIVNGTNATLAAGASADYTALEPEANTYRGAGASPAIPEGAHYMLPATVTAAVPGAPGGLFMFDELGDEGVTEGGLDL